MHSKQLLHYKLQCTLCGAEYEESRVGFLLSCPNDHPPALLRAKYVKNTFEVDNALPGIFRFADWLPVRRSLPRAPGPVVFQSQGIASLLRLENLFIVFSGYWPAKGAFMETCTFKELEAPPVCARIPEGEQQTLVVSSAGNTARAFLQVCSEHAIPLAVIVPEIGLPWLWMTGAKHPCVKIVAVQGAADYYDAIRLGNLIAEQPGYFPEGGAKNAARRDGLGTVLLSFVEATGRLPDHYVQAVGSGTGGISAWEMQQRLLADGRFGTTPMKLHLAQNAPFTPMVDAWKTHSSNLLPMTESDQKARLQQTRASMLSNRQPPYAVAGGVYDALHASGGYMYAVTNEEAERAGALFLGREGCDLDPAAEIALVALLQACLKGKIHKKDVILLNITGGGYTMLKRDKTLDMLEPDVVVAPETFRLENMLEQLQTPAQR